jgi:integrase
MPLKLVPPRQGKTPYWYVRGKYLGVALDHSTGTTEERVAKTIRRRWKDQIERGEHPLQKPADPVATTEPTFLAAAVAYMQAGGERKYLSPIIELNGEGAIRDTPISQLDQVAIDKAAAVLFPHGSAQTKNRQFYTPVSAVLKRAGIDKAIKRPKGWRGNKSTSWLEPVQAFALVKAADAVDSEFGIFLRLLLYTGMRLSEALDITIGRVDLQRRTIYLPETKNGEARPVYLPEPAVTALANHPRGLDRHSEQRLFRFHVSGRLRDMLNEAKRLAGIVLPRRQGGFHVFCHTYGTWMHRYGGLDNYGLTRTERWKDPRSADRYLHTEVSEEARRADLLPVDRPWKTRGSA